MSVLLDYLKLQGVPKNRASEFFKTHPTFMSRTLPRPVMGILPRSPVFLGHPVLLSKNCTTTVTAQKAGMPTSLNINSNEPLTLLGTNSKYNTELHHQQ